MSGWRYSPWHVCASATCPWCGLPLGTGGASLHICTHASNPSKLPGKKVTTIQVPTPVDARIVELERTITQLQGRIGAVRATLERAVLGDDIARADAIMDALAILKDGI